MQEAIRQKTKPANQVGKYVWVVVSTGSLHNPTADC